MDNPNIKKLMSFTDEERDAMRNCQDQAFWSRAIPFGSLFTAGALWSVKAGKIRTHTRFGAIPIVAGFGSCGYLIGKFSYIFSENCKNIFLEKAPDGIVSKGIKLQRAEFEENEELPNKFNDILKDIDHISEKEYLIMEDCNTVAFQRYSLPLLTMMGSSIYLAVRYNILNPSRILPAYPRLPKTVLGMFVGYMAGQWLYVHNADCPKRFQKYDYDGNIATLLRGQHHKQTADLQDSSQMVELEEQENYVYPDIENDLSTRIKNEWTNHLNSSTKI